MTFRTNLAATWAFLLTAVFWLRVHTTQRVGLAPLSHDWLLDLERRSTRGEY